MNKKLIAIAAAVCAAGLVIAGVIIAALHQKALPQQTHSAADSVSSGTALDSEDDPAQTDAKGKKTGKASADKQKTDKTDADSDGDPAEQADTAEDDSLPDDPLPDGAQADPDKEKEPDSAPSPAAPISTGDVELPQETVVPYQAPIPPGKVSKTQTTSDDGGELESDLSGVDLNQPEADSDPAENGNELPEVEMDDEPEEE